jgi:pimeloyl-ACP methyl ester carboxylesterase
VDAILRPGLLPGAAEVFLDFISYSGGPLPEDLLRQVACPVSIVWGEADPWEPLNKGREFAEYESVVDFTILEGVGHCPQDEAPQRVNPLVLKFVNDCEKK